PTSRKRTMVNSRCLDMQSALVHPQNHQHHSNGCNHRAKGELNVCRDKRGRRVAKVFGRVNKEAGLGGEKAGGNQPNMRGAGAVLEKGRAVFWASDFPDETRRMASSRRGGKKNADRDSILDRPPLAFVLWLTDCTRQRGRRE